MDSLWFKLISFGFELKVLNSKLKFVFQVKLQYIVWACMQMKGNFCGFMRNCELLKLFNSIHIDFEPQLQKSLLVKRSNSLLLLSASIKDSPNNLSLCVSIQSLVVNLSRICSSN